MELGLVLAVARLEVGGVVAVRTCCEVIFGLHVPTLKLEFDAERKAVKTYETKARSVKRVREEVQPDPRAGRP